MDFTFQKNARRKIFAERLTQSLASKGISQTVLAEFLDTTQQTVSRWCKGICEPDINTFCLICGLIEESPEYLLNFDENDIKKYIYGIIRDMVGNDKDYKKKIGELENKYKPWNTSGNYDERIKEYKLLSEEVYRIFEKKYLEKYKIQ